MARVLLGVDFTLNGRFSDYSDKFCTLFHKSRFVVAEKKSNVIRSIKIEEALIELNQLGYVRVLFFDHVVLDIDLQNKLLENYLTLCEGKKYPFLFEAMENVTVTKEARDNSRNLEEIAPVTKTAVVANTLPYRMIANFYLKFNKPKKPFKLFSTKKEALEWLLGKKV